MTIADVLAGTIREQDKIASSYATVGIASYIFYIFREKIKLTCGGVVIQSANKNDTFIVNHLTNGVVGVQPVGLQPVIGNRFSAKTTLVDTRT